MLKRCFDILCSGFGLILLFPLFVIISLTIVLTSKGSVFYRQKRVGIDEKVFNILKFRSMHTNSDKKGLLTVGDKDSRITEIGYYLRKYKLDELPQLINVFKGEMSLVGPRPEVPMYVDLYTEKDRIVLSVKPGITDYASIHFRNESELLKGVLDPEEKYIKEILPIKLRLNKVYIENKNFMTDIKIIFSTLLSIMNLNKKQP